jgi:hypothetical protein
VTAIGQINAGGRITASEVRGVAPLAAYKASGQSVTSSTTLVNDNDLFLAIAANGVYVVQSLMLISGGAGNFKYTFTIPSGASGNFSALQENTGGTLINEGAVSWTATTTGGTGQGIWLYGLLVNSSTAANLQLQWAQNASNGTPTTVGAYSYMTAWQIQ